jgi:hypothetical protein
MSHAKCLAHVHHILIKVVVSLASISVEDVVAGSKVAFVHRSTSTSPRVDPAAPEAVEDHLSSRTRPRIWAEHGFDDVVHGVLVVALDHELGRLSEILFGAGTGTHRGERVVVVRHQEAVHGGSRCLWNWVAIRVAAEGAALRTPGQAGENAIHLARPQLLPVDAILRNDTVAGNLCKHHAECEHIGWLVEATRESLGCEVVAVALTIDVLGRGPRAGEAEVGDLEATLEVDEDVGWLEVEMDVARVVDKREALRIN